MHSLGFQRFCLLAKGKNENGSQCEQWLSLARFVNCSCSSCNVARALVDRYHSEERQRVRYHLPKETIERVQDGALPYGRATRTRIVFRLPDGENALEGRQEVVRWLKEVVRPLADRFNGETLDDSVSVAVFQEDLYYEVGCERMCGRKYSFTHKIFGLPFQRRQLRRRRCATRCSLASRSQSTLLLLRRKQVSMFHNCKYLVRYLVRYLLFGTFPYRMKKSSPVFLFRIVCRADLLCRIVRRLAMLGQSHLSLCNRNDLLYRAASGDDSSRDDYHDRRLKHTGD